MARLVGGDDAGDAAAPLGVTTAPSISPTTSPSAGAEVAGAAEELSKHEPSESAAARPAPAGKDRNCAVMEQLSVAARLSVFAVSVANTRWLTVDFVLVRERASCKRAKVRALQLN